MTIILIALAILSALYGILILQIGSGTFFWMIWEVIGAGFLLWGLLLHGGFFEIHKKLGIAFYTIVISGVAVIAVLCIMIATQFTAKGTPGLDYIIVLGAQVREDGPSTVLKYRLDAAQEYLVNNSDTICIVSGGQGTNEPCTEAEAMAKYLMANGIEADRILLEDASRNTVQNIKNSKMLLNDSYNGVGIVTNNFHMFRGIKLAEAQGLENVYGIAADSHMLYLPNNVLRECCGILKDWLMNHI